MAAPSYTHTLANSTIATASYVMQNFTDILNGVSDGTKDLYINTLRTTGDVAIGSSSVNLGSVGGRWVTIMGTSSSAPGFIEMATPSVTTQAGNDMGGVNFFNGTVHAGEWNCTNSTNGASTNYYCRFRATTGTTALFDFFRIGGAGSTTASYCRSGYAARGLASATTQIVYDSFGASNTADTTGETIGATFSSAATSLAASYRSKPYTEAASYTTTTLAHYWQDQTINGTGATITREIAFCSEGIGSGGTISNFAVLSDNRAFTGGSWFLNQSGTNPSTLGGALTVNGQLIAKGTATNDSASAGYIGEYKSASASNVTFTTSGTIEAACSLSITAGDWDLNAVVTTIANGGTQTWWGMYVGTTSASASGTTYGDTRGEFTPATSTFNSTASLPGIRVSVSGTTTYYLNVVAAFSVANSKYYARLSARRVR